jgi:hypothetical protein
MEAPMPLVSHTPGVWSIAHPLTVGGILPMGTRTTILRLDSGGLLVHAPGPLDAADAAAVRALGPVEAIVAPNKEHHLFFAAARAAFPEARGYAVPGAQGRVRSAVDGPFGAGAAGPWEDGLLAVDVGGMPRLEETLLFHRASGTLVTCDLSFNIQRVEGWLPRTALELAGAYGRFGPSRLFRSWYLQDRPALRRTVDQLLDLPLTRIVLAHGETVDTDARATLEAAFDWLPTA